MNCLRLAETPSTNSYLKQIAHDSPHGLTVVTDNQTAGRGQRGNTWESAPGENLTFSLLLKPVNIKPASQFAISEAVALGVVGALRSWLPPHLGKEVKVKWPNDIYVGDRKICGILIEHSLSGDGISWSVAGIGLNVNQQRFMSDAPNPVAMTQLTGERYPLTDILETTVEEIIRLFSIADTPGGAEKLHAAYLDELWRGHGLHPFRLPSGETFMAEITGIDPTGMLTLTTAGSRRLTFAFKEVAFVL